MHLKKTASRAGATFVDVWEAFVDDRHQFALYGPDVNGQLTKLRTGDGVHFTRAGAKEFADRGINVNNVAPGMVDGPRFRDKVCADMAAIAPAPGSCRVRSCSRRRSGSCSPGTRRRA